MDSAKDDEIMEFLTHNFTALRTHPRFRNSLFVVFMETNNNYAHTDRVSQIFSQPKFGRVYFLTRDASGKGRVGVRTGPTEKQVYVDGLRLLLVNGGLHFADDMVAPWNKPRNQAALQRLASASSSSSADAKQNEAALKPKTAEDMKKVACTQLTKYKYHIVPPHDVATGKFKKEMSGKSWGCPDDICMDIQIVIYWAQIVQRDEKFLRYCEERRIPL